MALIISSTREISILDDRASASPGALIESNDSPTGSPSASVITEPPFVCTSGVPARTELADSSVSRTSSLLAVFVIEDSFFSSPLGVAAARAEP
ncbi:hypothetical protein CRG98_049860, partial [Punica granatum]